jgi:hypothetical protein
MVKKGLVFIIIWSCVIGGAFSQNNTSSPYTRFGYGSLVDAGFGQSKSMGGISFGLRDNRFMNPGNPASFTAIDSLMFRFEAAASLKFSSYSDAMGGQTKTNGNLEYLGFQFPIKKWLGISAGLIPYSFVGYDFENREVKPSSITGGSLETLYSYNGSGGITQLYLGAGVSPFRNFSLGANVAFNFGTIKHASTVSFTDASYHSTNQTQTIKVTDFTGLFGAQYAIPLPKEQRVTLGVIFQTKSKLNADAEQVNITTDTLTMTDNNLFDTPMTIGAGVVYNFSDRLTVGFDYKFQAWSDVRYFGEKPFVDRNKYAMGVEFQPDRGSKSYLSRMSYRLGANYSDSYIKVNERDLNEFVLSAGLGFPLKKGDNPTILNFVFEYGNMGTTDYNLIEEQYFKFTLNVTINERWFMKRKFD